MSSFVQTLNSGIKRFGVDLSLPSRKALFYNVLVAICYFTLGYIGLSFATINGNASPIWPASGFALAAVFLLGAQSAWGVFIGAFCVNLTTAAPLLVCLGIALGNTAEVLVANALWFACFKFGWMGTATSDEEVPLFSLLICSFFAPFVAAFVGMGSLLVAGAVSAENFWIGLATWWVGDSIGILAATPFFLILANTIGSVGFVSLHTGFKLALKAIGLCTIALAVSVILLLVNNGTAFLAASIPITMAILYRQKGLVTWLVFVVVAFAGILATQLGIGPFQLGSDNTKLITLQGFLGLLALSVVVLERLKARPGWKYAFGVFIAIQLVCAAAISWLVDTRDRADADKLNRLAETYVAEIRHHLEVKILKEPFNLASKQVQSLENFDLSLQQWRDLFTEQSADFGDISDHIGAEFKEFVVKIDLTQGVLLENVFQTVQPSPIVGRAHAVSQYLSRHENRLQSVKEITLGNNRLRFTFKPAASFITSHDTLVTWAAISFSLMALAAAVLCSTLVNEKGRAQKLAEQMNLLQRKDMANQLESSRMNSVGTLASGIAHEVNNPLMIMSAGLELIAKILSKSEESAKFEANRTMLQTRVVSLQKNVHRLQQIVFGLRVFSNVHEFSSNANSDLKDAIENAWSIATSKVRQGSADVSLELEIPIGTILKIPPSDLAQICAALFENSLEALSRCDAVQKWVSVKCSVGQSNVTFWISDSGARIEERVAQQIMDPFFTTKKVGDGPGLGLSVSEGLARKSGGFLKYVPNEANTTFELIFFKPDASNDQGQGHKPSDEEKKVSSSLRVA